MNVKLYIKNKEGDYVNIPLYGDESINYQSKISDVEDLETVFNDSTNTFTVPASSTTNAVFNYWFEIGVEGDFDIKEKVDGYLEINGVPYKFGKVQLRGVEYENNLPVYYRIEMFGHLLELSDNLKEDMLEDLEYLDNFNYAYTSENILKSLNRQHTLLDSAIVTPLFLYTDRGINVGKNDSGDICSTNGAIQGSELRPGIKVTKIIEAIEHKYDIEFKSDFFRQDVFEKLYLYLNNKDDIDDSLNWKPLKLDGDFSVVSDDSWYAPAISFDEDTNVFTFIRDSRQPSNQNYPIQVGTTFLWGNSLRLRFTSNFTGDIRMKLRIVDVDSGEVIYIRDEETVPYQTNITWSDKLEFLYKESDFYNVSRYRIEYITDTPRTISARVNARSTFNSIGVSPARGMRVMEIENGYSQDEIITSELSIRKNLPNMKVADFFKGIIQAFRLVIIPEGVDVFRIETLNEFYDNGNIVNLTPYLDSKTHSASTRDVFRSLDFTLAESEQIIQQAFYKSFGRRYGDLELRNRTLQGEKKVELPFTSLMMTSFRIDLGNDIQENLNVGLMQSLNSSGILESNMDGVFLFYFNGIQNLDISPIQLNLFGVTDSIQFIPYCDIVSDARPEMVRNILSWGEEMTVISDKPVDRTLYNNYWKRWVDTLYHSDSRSITYQGVVDYSLIDELGLDSRVIIGNQSYNINDFEINLTTNRMKISLFPFFPELVEDKSLSGVKYEYTYSPSKTYGTIDLGDYSEWLVTKIELAGNGIDWVSNNLSSLNIIHEGGDETSFKGRYYNFKIDENQDSQGNYLNFRLMTLLFENLLTGETKRILVRQSAPLSTIID